MIFLWANKGWAFLTLAVILAGVGAAVQFGLGVGFLSASGGFLFAAMVAASDNFA